MQCPLRRQKKFLNAGSCSLVFHADGPECVVFTLNCTQAINMVLKAMSNWETIVTSCLEHNAVSRPLQTMADRMHVTFTGGNRYPG
ncbi:MAG: aminotransferase class V-fold PLP-dependent enzyme [Acutalibacteraceae bacterium]